MLKRIKSIGATVLFLAIATPVIKAQTIGAPRGNWSELPPLPLAVSGHFAGESRGALITVGGAHFPTPLFEGGTKEWVSGIQVLPPQARFWMPFQAALQPVAYGASISDGKGLICLGGGDAQAHFREVFRLDWTGNTLVKRALPPLPKACAFMGAARLGSTIYVVGGQETPTSTSAFHTLWALNFIDKNATWRELAPLPGPGRILPVVCAQNGALYVFSGASLAPDAQGKAQRTYLKDAWRFEPRHGWKSVASPPHALVAAPSAAWGKTRILVFGGDDGSLAARTQELKDKHPGFRREVLAYDTKTDTWTTVDTMPISLVTTNAVVLKNSIVIPGGEDRPGHRNPRVLRYSPHEQQ